MAAPKDGEAKLKKNQTPLLIGMLVVLAVVAVWRFYPMLLGRGAAQSSTAPVRNAENNAAAVTAAKGTAPAAAAKPVDPLASFLVYFGRSNPFAPYRGGGSATAANSGTSLEELQNRLNILNNGQAAGPSNGQPSGPNGSNNSRNNAASTGQPTDTFVLTGIVTLQESVLVVIRKGEKEAYIAGLGDALGKTGYKVKAINGTKVTITKDDNDTVLVLGGKKP